MKKIKLKKLLGNLGRTSTSNEVEFFLNDISVKRRPYLDDEDIDQGVYNQWIPIKKLGLELEFKSKSIFDSLNEELVSQSPLILTSYIFYSEMDDIRSYPYKLPYKLSFNDSRDEVRAKLKPQDAIFKPYDRDVWIFRSHKLIVSYADDDTVIDITYMLFSQDKIDKIENADIKNVIHLFGENTESKKLSDIFNFFDYNDFLGKQDNIDPRFLAKEYGFGIDFTNASVFEKLQQTGLVLSEIIFYRKGYLDFSYGYNGELPFNLSFEDNPGEFIKKINFSPVDQYEVEGKLEGHALWVLPDFSVKIVYSTLMNNIARIHVYPSWYWNDEDKTDWTVESKIFLA